ncbi:hypothetical protein KBD34_02180 [Patescibacteria group bacterium]|nr:hypothetical protein [Patescibacteria group bacterium]
MFLSSTQDVWYSVASICLAVITVFLCLVLYRLLSVLRQADEIVKDARAKITSLEETIELLAERFTSISGYASLVTEGGKKLLSLLSHRSSSSKKAKRKGLDSDDEDEE